MKFAICTVLAVTGLLAGCVEVPDKDTMPPSGTPFAGLNEIIQKNGPIRMLLVHGMSDHDLDWGKKYLAPYALRLKATLGAGDGPFYLTPEHFPDNDFLKAHKNLTDKYSAVLQRFQIIRNDDGKLIIEAYVLTWSPLTDSFKSTRFKDDDALDRLEINGKAKSVVNHTLADVVLLLAGYDKHVMEDSVCAAVEIFDKHGLGEDGIDDPNAPIVLLSESLGSIMLSDAILGELPYEVSKEARKFNQGREHKKMLRNTKLFIMNANQLPLLDAWPSVTYDDLLGTKTSDAKMGPPDVSLKNLKALGNLRGKATRESGIKEKPMDLLVLTDLNDDLSYYLAVTDVPPEIRIINLRPVNSEHYYIPFKYPHLFENPETAHTGYKDNPAVADAVVNEQSGD